MRRDGGLLLVQTYREHNMVGMSMRLTARTCRLCCSSLRKVLLASATESWRMVRRTSSNSKSSPLCRPASATAASSRGAMAILLARAPSWAEFVPGNYLRTFGLQAQAGRLFKHPANSRESPWRPTLARPRAQSRHLDLEGKGYSHPRKCNRISRGQRMPPKTADTIFLSLRRGVPSPPNKGVE
jgi:hypothetical protein